MKFSPFFHVLCTISINISISMEIFFMIIINNVSILEYWIFYTLTFYLYPVIIFKKTRIILYWNSKNRYFINKKNCSLRVSDKKKIWFRRYKLIIEWKYTKILIICNAHNLESSKNSYINFFYREIGHK